MGGEKHMKTCIELINKRKQLWQTNKSIEKDREYRQALAVYLLEHEPLRQEIQQKPELLIEMFFVIVDKELNTVPFFLNHVQRKFMDHLNQAIEDYKAGRRKHLKFLLLKSRQQGFTSCITAYQLASVITKRNFTGITVADDIDNTNTIFEKKAKFPYSMLPDTIQPSEKYNNRKELMFDKLNSMWSIATAGAGELGRSRTINFFHGSECAFWKSISNVITGLGEALTQGAIQILESTANGYNEYKDLCDNAPDNTWEMLFYVWWDTPEYRLPFYTDRAKTEFITMVNSGTGVFDKLRHLHNTHGLTYEQLHWYYEKYKGYIDKERIKQEYPCTPEEAFLSSGRCVFDQEIIQRRIDTLTNHYKEKPPKRGYFTFQWLSPDYKDTILLDTIKFVESAHGYITIYEQPKEGYPYVIGGDTKGEGSDKFAGTVIDNTTGDRVATLHRDLGPDTYAHQMFCLGHYYNQALIGIEVNFDIYPIKELERLNYPNQYMRQTVDKIKGEIQKRYGFKTDGNTRPLIIDKAIVNLRDNITWFNDITMLKECLTFIINDKGRPEHESGKHDDLLFSDMIAELIRDQQSYAPSGKKGGSKDHWTSDMWEDYYNAPAQIQEYLERKWAK